MFDLVSAGRKTKLEQQIGQHDAEQKHGTWESTIELQAIQRKKHQKKKERNAATSFEEPGTAG